MLTNSSEVFRLPIHRSFFTIRPGTCPVFDVLDEDGRTCLENILRMGSVTLLVGSKISEWAPSDVPSGMDTTRQVANLLAGQLRGSGDEQRRLADYIQRAPFEYVLERCPRMDVIRPLLSEVYRISSPNAVHTAIANLVNRGRIHSIVTPNYDLCLDTLLPDGAPLHRVIQEDDAIRFYPGSRAYFKIHGSAENGLESTMVLALSEEGILRSWKQRILRACVEDRILLVLGFSGLDFEISPYLVASRPRLVVWNSYRNPLETPEALTPNAERILYSSSSVIMAGDLRHILADLDAPFRWRNPSYQRNGLGRLLASALSQEELKVWAASVLTSPGYVRYGKSIANDLRDSSPTSKEMQAKSTFLTGDLVFSAGRYSQTAAAMTKAAQIYQSVGAVSDYVFCEAKAIDALRCVGRFAAAHSRLKAARDALLGTHVPNRGLLDAKLDLQEILLIREKYSRACMGAKLRLPGAARLSREQQEMARSLLTAVLPILADAGQWHDIQQCRMWAERLDIPFEDVYKDSMEPLDTLAGWRHLGHLVPEMMSVRGALCNKRYDEAPAELVRQLIVVAHDIGCDPEVWKLTLALWKHYGFRVGDSLLAWIPAFLHCDYTLEMRLVKLLFEEYR